MSWWQWWLASGAAILLAIGLWAWWALQDRRKPDEHRNRSIG